jgi:hypothetical protein
MPLPKIATPTYELTLPSTKKKIKYRPFLVKEEKILVMAMESDDLEQVARAIKDVLSACILTRGINVETLSTFDIEYLFLNVRGKSVGETIEVLITCEDDGETKVPVSISIDEIEVKESENHTRDIKVDENLTLRMKYPSLSEFISQNFGFDDKIKASFDVIAGCVDMIFSEEETWNAKDYNKKEWIEFIEQMNSVQFKEIERFFETMPKLSHTVEVENPNTGVMNVVLLEGLASFFS